MLDVAGAAHIFYEAREKGAEFSLHFVALNAALEIKSSAGLYFSRLEPFKDFSLTSDDFVFVPGLEYPLLSNREFLRKCRPFFDWLRQQQQQQAYVCSICTGTFLLAEAGLLQQKSCTTHWRYLSKFSQRFPDAKLEEHRLFVADNRVYTSAGVTSGIDLALYIIEELLGTKFALDVAKEVVIYFRRGESDPQLSIFLQYRNHLETRIHQVQDYMLKHLEQNFTIQDIADEVYMSARNLTRLFKKTTGVTIGFYLDKLKVERAVQLLADGNKVDFVASKCGFKSANRLRALLKKHQGLLPTEIANI